GPHVFIAYLGQPAKEKALKMADELRKQNISLIVALGNKSLKAQMRQANSAGVRYTIIIGEEEIKAGTVQLRDMSTSRQETIPESRLIEVLKE
ncbi:MAG: His/Gly/Thr/Pro-type tRNA ligase C-terminal domain-containing protein, partial [Dehalococcoidales bacterium]|nr:His/Gly/Thr/Pro-type tRNA ligase C-terminal domain-containing protein [Dehalococcoidales bacterium]